MKTICTFTDMLQLVLQTKQRYKHCAQVKPLHLNKTKFALKLKTKVTCNKGDRNIGYTKFGGKILSAMLSDNDTIMLLERIMDYL